ncbi:MAG TPA: hypothetical protein VLF68_01350 [Candidatus Saccharimonadales bacterium]|nr:hypothetical protein [Candidatus Saccharimonadales bacterium]
MAEVFVNEPQGEVRKFLSRLSDTERIRSTSGIYPISRFLEDCSMRPTTPFAIAKGLIDHFSAHAPTASLAEMYGENNEAIPQEWKEPEIMRSLLSMTGSLEAGMLEAETYIVYSDPNLQPLAAARRRDNPARIQNLRDFVNGLQQTIPQGEVGNPQSRR